MSFRERVELFAQQAVDKAVNGLTLTELGQLFVALIIMCVESAKDLKNDGVDKKQFVMDAVDYLFSRVAPMIPLPMVLQPFRPLLQPILRKIVLAIADGVIEGVYARLKTVPVSDPVVRGVFARFQP